MMSRVIAQRHQLHVISHSGIEERGWSAEGAAKKWDPCLAHLVHIQLSVGRNLRQMKAFILFKLSISLSSIRECRHCLLFGESVFWSLR